MLREIIFDIETTGLYVDDGNRIISVGMVEMVDGVETGKKLQFYVNPERDSEPEALKVHKLTTEFLSQFPSFAEQAQEIRDFIGDDRIVITCRTSLRDGKTYTLDKAFLEKEFEMAGIVPPKDEQWLNVRGWSEEMFGDKNARLDKILDHYKVDRSERDAKGHGALLDAELLATVYPKLKTDYKTFKTPSKGMGSPDKPKP